MKIKLSRNDLFMDDTCVICGEEFPPDIITATAYSDDNSRAYGVVCPRCIHDGPAAVKQSIEEQIKTLRERAGRLLDVAAGLEAEAEHPLEIPTWEKWRLVHLKTFLRHINMLDNERVSAFRQSVKAMADDDLQIFIDKNASAPESDDPLLQAQYAIAWHERESRQEQKS